MAKECMRMQSKKSWKYNHDHPIMSIVSEGEKILHWTTCPLHVRKPPWPQLKVLEEENLK